MKSVIFTCIAISHVMFAMYDGFTLAVTYTVALFHACSHIHGGIVRLVLTKRYKSWIDMGSPSFTAYVGDFEVISQGYSARLVHHPAVPEFEMKRVLIQRLHGGGGIAYRLNLHIPPEI